ncbi:hypothetical protein E2562_008533 [Oryza meyeriana var. granulata]|uniref:Uncharacterized protein n=1 Tax=Oryza meyeriana var. granulata TaxID=110450 RepID=A0A6G1C6L2_9ORYZ|nr:hypothetical protein E2562_008533 [Oryza meyeriana var. granulata]
MKKPSILLRSLSSRLSTRLAPSPAVAPWPPVRSAYDRWLAAELDELRAGPLAAPYCASAAWLARALGFASAAQRRLVASTSAAPGVAGACIDRKSADECVEDTAELLDACAGLRDRLEMISGYVSSMRVALHWLEGCGGGAVVTARRRAAAAFVECEAVVRRCGAELAKCGSNLRKLGERALTHAKQQHGDTQRDEALAGARAAALLAIGALGAALAFRPRRAVSVGVAPPGNKSGGAPWECALQEVQKQLKEEYERRRKEGVPCMAELDAAAAAGRTVQRAVAAGRQCPDSAVAAARRRCDELEEKVFVLDEKVGELHRELIGVRMVLLEWSQTARGHQLLKL